MDADRRPRRALALHSAPEEIEAVLAPDPRFEWAFASAPGEVEAALRAHRPEVVFSIKQSTFPGPAHVPAVLDPGVRWFHVAGSGTDHVDGHLRPDQRLTTGRGVLAPFLAERAMAGLLHLVTGMDAMRAAAAEARWAPTRFRPLAGRRVLVVGAGEIGEAFAHRVRPFGCRVVGIRASAEMRPGFDEMHGPEALDELLPAADVLALHVRLDERTRGLIDRRRLALLPEGALLLNASRGAVVEEAALPAALEAGLAGAWLDVFEQEPLPETSPLWRHPRVLVSPHQADQVDDFPARFARHFLGLPAEDPAA